MFRAPGVGRGALLTTQHTCILQIGWEYIIFLPEEIQLHRRKRYNAATILLLIVR